ncbi:MAG: transcription termination factor Rho [Terrimicrobiaceae bacterium]
MSDPVTPTIPTDAPRPAPAAPPPPITLDDMHRTALPALLAEANKFGLRIRAEASRRHIVLDLARYHLSQGGEVTAEGILEMNGEHGTLRWLRFSLKPGPDDVFVHRELLKRLKLKSGLRMKCTLKLPDKDRGLAAASIVEIEGIPVADWQELPDFDKLTPLFPDQRVFLDGPAYSALSARAVDLLAPLGMGQRGIIAAPPRSGKTMLLKTLAHAIRNNAPDVHLMLLLVDERPEEVTDFKAELDCEIYSSTFDEPVTRHVQVCEAVCDRAKRLVEMKRDVVILLDSITRMARGYNNLQPGKGRTMSGGVDSKALARPRKFFGSARNVEEGGSLTILATALIETKSKMDDLIFEEFKGTGNMEVYLDRQIAEQRIFPAIHITRSGTRREDLLYHPDEYERIVALRKQLMELPAAEAMEILFSNLQHTRSNVELLMTGLRGV